MAVDETIIGIDPGQKGAVCIMRPGLPPELHVMPDLVAFADLIDPVEFEEPVHIFIEKAQSFPKGGVASSFNYGQHFGELLGVIIAFQHRHTLVRPAIWTRAMHAGTKDDKPKVRSLEAARRLFPKVELKATDRSKVAHDGLVDSLLIAEFGRRSLT